METVILYLPILVFPVEHPLSSPPHPHLFGPSDYLALLSYLSV